MLQVAPRLSRRQLILAGITSGYAFSFAGASAAKASVRTVQPPQRIVAAGGVVTEIVYALGRGELLVGVDSTSLYPPSAQKLAADIGYVRALSAEGILSLRPDCIIAVEGAGPADVLKLAGEAGIPVIRIPETYSEDGVAERIRKVGAAIGEEAAGNLLAEVVRQKFAGLTKESDAVRQHHKPKRVLFILSMQNGRIMVGGRNSSADAIITLAGGINAAEAIEGFKPISDEGLLRAAPDMILMMQRGPLQANPDEVFAHPALSLLPAARTKSLISMDGLYLLGFGPRTPDAARDLMTGLYPSDHTRAALAEPGRSGFRQP